MPFYNGLPSIIGWRKIDDIQERIEQQGGFTDAKS